jgi:hypothetical protein
MLLMPFPNGFVGNLLLYVYGRPPTRYEERKLKYTFILVFLEAHQ